MINLGDLAKPATVLIEKISDAIGGALRPGQIIRIARAEAEADKIRAESRLEITELEQRAMHRFFAEEAKKQANIESITQNAIPLLAEGAKPEEVDDDWITNFFDKGRLISDKEMQAFWSKVLAGEANAPGSFSKRTVNMLGSLDKDEALLFQNFCGFCWYLNGNAKALIFDHDADIYKNHGITFGSLKHLDSIGLVSAETIADYAATSLPKRIILYYFGRPVEIEMEKEDGNELNVGHVILTNEGKQLAAICGSEPVPGFFNYVVEMWQRDSMLAISLPK